MKKKQAIAAIGAAAVVVASWLLLGRGTPARVAGGGATRNAVEESPTASGAPVHLAASASGAPAASGPRAAAARVSRAQADALRAKLQGALSAAPAEPGRARPDPTPVPSAAPRVATLDRKYIRSAISEIQPLIEQCFAIAQSEDPKLKEANVLVHFSIAGDADIGGVVDDSKVDDGTPIPATLAQCVRETMYSLELPAPTSGQGRVEVTYPFRLGAKHETPDAGAARQ